MKILLGTTNPSKVRRFRGFLAGFDAELITPADLGITAQPEESGRTPEENAAIKARFYGQYFDRVICNDSGLYFAELPLDDPRQPGLHIRSPQGIRLSDDEALSYYAGLVRSLGGQVTAWYMDGVGVYDRGRVSTFMDPEARGGAFYMVDVPSAGRHPGWPLDSLSLNRGTRRYFTEAGNDLYDDSEEQVILGEYRKRLTAFLVSSLGLEKGI